jgi:hypothetical protein
MQEQEYLVICPFCEKEMKLGGSKWGRRYRCKTCKTTHGAHPDGKPLGTVGDMETRQLRSIAHQKMNMIWSWNDKHEKSKMYAWLKDHTRTGHIGSLNKHELMGLIKRINRMIKRSSLDWKDV